MVKTVDKMTSRERDSLARKYGDITIHNWLPQKYWPHKHKRRVLFIDGWPAMRDVFADSAAGRRNAEIGLRERHREYAAKLRERAARLVEQAKELVGEAKQHDGAARKATGKDSK